MMAWSGNSHLLLVEEGPCLPFYSSCLEGGLGHRRELGCTCAMRMPNFRFLPQRRSLSQPPDSFDGRVLRDEMCRRNVG